MIYRRMNSPVGELVLGGDESGLRLIEFHGDAGAQDTAATGGAAVVEEAVRQLTAYFAGERQEFDLELAPTGTEFQTQVWLALAEIAYGETISYAELARRVGNPRACRAVGAANGRNPLPIVLPCHRVIGKSGDLTGYGGGLEIKRALLSLERRTLGQEPGLLWD